MKLGDRLDSWKEIAAYLRRGERTVRRWEELEGLPVHRLAHEKRGSVYAYRAELDAWWEARKQQVSAHTDTGAVETTISDPEPSSVLAAPNRRIMWGAATVALILVALTAAWIFRFRNLGSLAPRFVAVLPFENLSHDPAEEWFSDGITETLITELSKVRSLKVISRTSAMQYKNARKSLKQIGSELGVDAVVEGSALKVGARVRITAQLIAVASDTHLWGRDFDGDFQDVLALQKTVTRAIAQEVGLSLSDPKSSPRTANPEAIAAYLKGLHHFNRGEIRSAIDLARDAIRADPDLAPAHELLGSALLTAADFHGVSYAKIESEAKSALQRALELEPDRGMSLSSLGWSYFVIDHNWVRAEEYLRRGYELEPAMGTLYGFFLAAQGRYDLATQAADQALLYDPANALSLTDAARIYHFARRYDKAIRLFNKAIELSPTGYSQVYLPLTLLQAGRKDQAFEAWLQWRYHSQQRAVQIRPEKYYRDIYRAGGWNAVWRALLDEMPKTPWLHWRQFAAIYLHRTQEALDEVEQIEHWADALQLEDPVFDSIRGEARFQALVTRIGYPQSMLH